MSGKQTYQQEAQIRRYLQNQMTEAERNAFEREMQSDPFLTDAVEGLSAFSSDRILSDIQTLKAEVQKGRHSDRRYIWYAAASVLVIVISTFIFFNLEENPNRILTENIQEVESKVILEVITLSQNQEQNATERKKVQVSEQESTEVKSERKVAEEEKPVMETIPIRGGQSEENTAPPEKLAVSVKSLSQRANVPKTISGVVTDSSDRPLPGVAIVVKGTSKGTITDENGKYYFTDVPDSSFIVFSFVGMKPREIPFEDKVQLDISLKEDHFALSEVVVGYGTQRKSSLTGAVSSVKSEQLIDGKASPVGGWEAFEEYLKAELTTPKIGRPEKETTVRLSFVITETGEKAGFEILKSEDETYSKEAIRIINEGPAWIPEIMEKAPQKSVVKLKLVFEP